MPNGDRTVVSCVLAGGQEVELLLRVFRLRASVVTSEESFGICNVGFLDDRRNSVQIDRAFHALNQSKYTEHLVS